MKFLDEVAIHVKAGHGGSGCVSFRREKHIPLGGPNGGDGGKGGSVVLKSTHRKRTLFHFRFSHLFKADRGGNGLGSRKTGKNGEDLILEVPVGTVVSNEETGEVLFDFTEPDQEFAGALGGRGGQGNTRFKSSTHRSPRFAQPGEEGEDRNLKLELKLLADAGIMGLPNAGKSTLISVISSAKPKIANYPFTTLTPNLGVVAFGSGETFVAADIPGLIEGAHLGAGLGVRFLKHIERTRIFVHVVDASQIDPDAPMALCETVEAELAGYDKKLAQKPKIMVLNKMDIPEAEELADVFEAAYGSEVFRISAVTGLGVEKLKYKILELVKANDGGEI